MNAEELKKCSEQIDWWHTMDLGQGVVTKGTSDPKHDLLPRIDLPEDLTGKKVLDIGAWDGFMSFECERRHGKVMALDSFVWNNTSGILGHATGMDGFDLAHEVYDSEVVAVNCEVVDMDPRRLGTFDVVLFLGVLYHMRHPLLALEKVASVTEPGGLLILESHVELRDPEIPMMRFYPGSELNNDPTNWWGLNPMAVVAMLKDVGFTAIKVVSITPSWPASRIALHAWKM